MNNVFFDCAKFMRHVFGRHKLCYQNGYPVVDEIDKDRSVVLCPTLVIQKHPLIKRRVCCLSSVVHEPSLYSEDCLCGVPFKDKKCEEFYFLGDRPVIARGDVKNLEYLKIMFRILIFAIVLEDAVGGSVGFDTKTIESLRLLTTGRYIIVLDRSTVTTGSAHFQYKYTFPPGIANRMSIIMKELSFSDLDLTDSVKLLTI